MCCCLVAVGVSLTVQTVSTFFILHHPNWL